MVFRGSENYLPELPCISLSLYYCIVILVVSFCSSGVPRGEVLLGYGWEENRVVHDDLVRVLALEHTLLGAGAYIQPLRVYKFTIRYVGQIILCIFFLVYKLFLVWVVF